MFKRIILPHVYGQTCNQLFQISHWLPAAIEYGIPLYFPGFRRYAHLFSGTTHNQRVPRFPNTAPDAGILESALACLCSYAVRVPRINIAPLHKLASKLPGVVTITLADIGCEEIPNPREVIVDTRIHAGQSLWVQRAWDYLDCAGLVKHKSRIKEFFSPIPEIQHRVDSCIRKYRERDVVLVGVHLRRGDYSKWNGGKYYYNDTIYRGLMHRIVEIMPDRKVCFLLVSNHPLNKSNYDGLPLAAGPGDPAGDLFSLAACDYIMGPPSTFTLWASFFGDVPLYTINNSSDSLRIESFAVIS